MPGWRLPLLVLLAVALSPGGAAGHYQIGLEPAKVVNASERSIQADPDGDGLRTWRETHRTLTNPRRFDTDGDRFGDGDEVRAGSDPRNRASIPFSPTAPLAIGALPSPPPSGESPPPDTTPPNTSILFGPPGSTTSTKASFSFSATESGSTFECKLDGSSWAPCTSPRSYTSMAVGAHTFTVRAKDAAGNTDLSPATRSWTVQVDTAPPNTSIVSGPSGATTSTAASFGFFSTESDSTFECKLDDGAWTACTSPQAYSSLGLGIHTFSVRATDGSGNTDLSPATRGWTIDESGPGSCSQTLAPGANLSTAISNAAGGTVICLDGGSWAFNVSQASKPSPVIVRSADGTTASIGHSQITRSNNLRFHDLHFTGGVEMLGDTHHIEFHDNEFSGSFGIRANGEDASAGTAVTDVVIEGNYLHDLDYTGSQGTADGYGITVVNGVQRFVIANNTIKSVAADYIQSASPVDFTVDGNTFLGPTLVDSHPQEHQDLWQIFGGGKNVVFTDNVARNTGTHESLLFQEGSFSNVVIENNLFDHDSRGYTCQIYQSTGLVFRKNTIVGSHWGCLFRDDSGMAPGSGYQIDHNVFADTVASADLSAEGRASSWGIYDYNVSSDSSADGPNSVPNWTPSWQDTVEYEPLGLHFTAGYRAP
jgi:Right handed beta helix region